MAAVAVLVVLALPPRQRRDDTAPSDGTIAGAFHVHSNRSDGSSSPDVIAAAAARAGLRFVVFTDHGDATRKPDPPTYRSGVLCIDAVEISTDDGHVIALGIGAAPYRLAGEGRDVVEDVHRLGGKAIAAHPDSPREELRWHDWQVPLDGFEVVNLDTVWRRHLDPIGWRTGVTAIRDLATYLVRPGQTIAAMASDGAVGHEVWQALAQRPRVALFGGLDAHARLDLRSGEPQGDLWSIGLPGYETVFRTLTTRLRLPADLSGQPADDANAVLRALIEGHSYAALESVLAPPAFEYFATTDRGRVEAGEELPASAPISFTIRTNAPESFTTSIWRDGAVFAKQPSSREWQVAVPPDSGAYRVVIQAADWPGQPAWIVSNPILVRRAGAEEPLASDPNPPARAHDAPAGLPGQTITPERWVTESSPEAKVALDVGVAAGRPELRMRFGLPPGRTRDQYVAAALPVEEGLAGLRTVSFSVRSSQPIRASMQLRAPGLPDLPRWRRSFYADEEWRTHVLAFEDFRAAGITPSPTAPLAQVRSLLLVLDQVNTVPGTSGRVWLTDIVLR